MFEKTKQSSETTWVLESRLMCEVKKYEMQTKNFYLPENMRLNSVQITETSQDYVVMNKNLKSHLLWHQIPLSQKTKIDFVIIWVTETQSE